MSCRSQSQRAATVRTSVEPGTSASRTSVSASCAYAPTASCVSATSAVSVLPLASTSNVRLRTSWRGGSTPAGGTVRRPARGGARGAPAGPPAGGGGGGGRGGGAVGPAEARADLGEGPRRPAAGEVAVAVVARVGERERPVEGASRAAETKA